MVALTLRSAGSSGGGRCGPAIASSGTSISSAYTKLSDRLIAMIAANCRSATVAVSHNGSAVATVLTLDDSTGVPISIVESLRARQPVNACSACMRAGWRAGAEVRGRTERGRFGAAGAT
jgi:hypothetical protein